jgi:hypothetical protein
MAYPRFLAEIHRRRRMQDPEHLDNGSYQLIKIMGFKWWIRNGFHREHPVPRGGTKSPLYIDMANPKVMLAIEADGDQYHTDVLKEQWRDSYLQAKGWYVLHFRWADLVNHPDECCEDIIDAYEALCPQYPDGQTHAQRVANARAALRERRRERMAQLHPDI